MLSCSMEVVQKPVSVQKGCMAEVKNDDTPIYSAGRNHSHRSGGGGGSGQVITATAIPSNLPVRGIVLSSAKAVKSDSGSAGSVGQMKNTYNSGIDDGGKKINSGARKPTQQILSGSIKQQQTAAAATVTSPTPSAVYAASQSRNKDWVWVRAVTKPSPSPPTGVQQGDRGLGSNNNNSSSNSNSSSSSGNPVTSSRDSPLLQQYHTTLSTTADLQLGDSSRACVMDNADDVSPALSSYSDNDDDDEEEGEEEGDDNVTDDKNGSEKAVATGATVSTSVTTTTASTTTTSGMAGNDSSGGGGGGGPIRNLRVRGQRKFLPEKTRHKRQTLQDMTRPLKQWLIRHKDNPYPSKAEKMELVAESHMTLTQVSNWFANARRRLKNTVKQPDLSWASRIRLYNSCVEGNAELFSIGSDDSCPESDIDMMEHRQSDTFHDDVTDSLTSSRTATPDVTTAAQVETCASFSLHHHHHSGSSSNSSNHSATRNGHHSHPSNHSFHQTHSTHSNSSSSSSSNGGVASSSSGQQGSSSSSSSRAPARAPPPACPGLEEACASFPKYKHSILHRYLSDSHQQALILDEDSVAKSRDRHHSSSTGSRDFEELSSSSVSSPAHESLHHDHLEDFSEEFETMALRKRTSEFTSGGGGGEEGQEDMYWKEIGAALALTSLARGRIVNST